MSTCVEHCDTFRQLLWCLMCYTEFDIHTYFRQRRRLSYHHCKFACLSVSSLNNITKKYQRHSTEFLRYVGKKKKTAHIIYQLKIKIRSKYERLGDFTQNKEFV